MVVRVLFDDTPFWNTTQDNDWGRLYNAYHVAENDRYLRVSAAFDPFV
jgi:hypothetical protein